MRWLKALARRFKAMAVDDSQAVQTIQVMVRKGVVFDQVERYQQYGLTSVPDVNEGVAGLVIEVAGHRFVLGLEEPGTRPKDLQAGDVMLYHREGHHIHLLKGGKLAIKATEMDVNCPLTRWQGDIQQDGKQTSTGDQVAGGISQMQHTHPGDSGGTTGGPQ